MTILLTGSRCLDYYLGRKDSKSDWDFIASESELNKLDLSYEGKDCIRHVIGDNIIEFINKDLLNNNVFIGTCITLPFIHNNNFFFNYNFCSLEELYIQKRSHIWRKIKFGRHINELEKIKKECLDINGSYPSLDHPILKDRIKLTKEKYGHRAPSLNKTNEDFFNDKVTKYYIHDDIHKVVAHYDIPLYEKMKRDYSLAKCEKDMWDQFSHDDKIKCVREEVFTIALERFVVPKLENNEPYAPMKITTAWSLEKVCTTLCSGWFRDFAIDNFFEILNHNTDFYTKFFKAIESGELKKCLSTTY